MRDKRVNGDKVERSFGRALVLFLVLCLATLAPGCTTFTDTVPLGAETGAYLLYGERTIGQTFVCHHAGLTGIGILAEAGAGDLVLHLRTDAESATDVATVTIAPQAGDAALYHRFSLPVQDDVNGASFFVLLEAPGATAADPFVVPYTTGLSGTDDLVLSDGGAVSGRVSMQLHYGVFYILKDLVRQALSYGGRTLWLLFLSALFYLLPGGAAVVWLLREGEWIERTILASGLSVAVYALLVYATMTGLRLGRGAILEFLAVCAVLIGARWWLDRREGAPLCVPAPRAVWRSIKRDPSPVVLAVVFVLVLGVRIFVVRDLVAPMFGDGYHHTMIAQLLVDNGGLFDSWQPYAPLTTFTYHFGFHANVAAFHWLSGDDVIHSVIWIGQMLNALACLGLYPLALRVSGGNRWAGVGAVLVAGLLSPMPMYYVNWGRYTQLAGQVILPALMWLTWQVGEQERWRWGVLFVMGVTLAGLAITHYRVLIVYCVFAVGWLPVFLLMNWCKWRHLGQVVLRFALVAGIAGFLFVPWGENLFSARLPYNVQRIVERGSQSEYQRETNSIGKWTFFVPWSVVVVSALALFWEAFEHRFKSWQLFLWTAGLLVVANPYLFRLPGTGMVDNLTVFLLFYIPLGTLAGITMGKVYAWISDSRQRLGIVLLWAVLLVGSGWFLFQRITDVDTRNALLTRSDMEAMAWIRDHTLPDTKFLVNGFAAYGERLVVGADAGWWIPLLTGRDNTVPPLMYGTELGLALDYREQVRADYARIVQLTPTALEVVRLLENRGVTHVYVGEKMGMVGNPGEPLLDVETLLADPAYAPVYREDGVIIFELLSETR